jgi:hypothetical protein
MKKIFLLILLFKPLFIYPTVLITGPATASNSNATFNSTVTATAFDYVTGSFYVATNSSGDPTLQRAAQALQGIFPGFVAVYSEETNAIEFMTLTAQEGAPPIGVTYVEENTSGALLQDVINIVNPTGTVHFPSLPLNDASGASGTNGQTTTGIVGIASSFSFIFAGVRPNAMASSQDFGAVDSGIAVVAVSPTSLALTQVAAVNGDSGIKAALLDPTIPAVNIGSAGNPTLFPSGTSAVDMIWDHPLRRLYVPLLVQVNAAVSAGSRSVVVGQVLDIFGHLQINSIAPNSAFSAGATNEIIGLLKTSSDTTQPFLSVNHVRVMHCSTGPSYLIVNGDVGGQSNIGNLMYALPLVDVGDPYYSIQGTIADKNSALINGTFVVPATAPDQMPLNTDEAATVGAGPVPFTPTEIISDMVVIGDTVYVGLDTTTSYETDTGILYSQAMFDETGRVISWTPWTRRAFPINGFPTQSIFGPILFFEIDPSTATVWAVDGQTQQIVRATGWQTTQANSTNLDTSLVGNLNAVMTGPATSVLDLDQSTPGFTDGNPAQPFCYALFGSTGSVTFVVPSISLDNTLDSPQQVITDFSRPGHFLYTELPTNCPITSLEYARQLPGVEKNYFFAGNVNGLFVFGDQYGHGFDANSLNFLTHWPFANHGWVQVDPNLIPGAIIDIKTSGLVLYVLACTSSTEFPIQTTLYLIPFHHTIGEMFSPYNIFVIAQSNTGPFKSALFFSGMQLIMTSDSSEQLILATNHGLYQSACLGGVQDAADQLEANWQPPSFDTSYYNGIAAVDNTSITGTLASKLWPFALQHTPVTCITKSSIWQQLLLTTDFGPYVFDPAFFNAETIIPAFATLPLTSYFWSDGARRLAVINPFSQTSSPSFAGRGVVYEKASRCPAQQIFSLPYDTFDSGITNINNQALGGSVLTSKSRFYWIKDIGSSGIIMAGTEHGVVALQ